MKKTLDLSSHDFSLSLSLSLSLNSKRLAPARNPPRKRTATSVFAPSAPRICHRRRRASPAVLVAVPRELSKRTRTKMSKATRTPEKRAASRDPRASASAPATTTTTRRCSSTSITLNSSSGGRAKAAAALSNRNPALSSASPAATATATAACDGGCRVIRAARRAGGRFPTGTARLSPRSFEKGKKEKKRRQRKQLCTSSSNIFSLSRSLLCLVCIFVCFALAIISPNHFFGYLYKVGRKTAEKTKKRGRAKR